MPAVGQHPTEATLVNFAQGRLAAPEADAIARHLEGCPACRSVAEQAPDDSFMNRVRGANPKPAGSSYVPTRGDAPVPGSANTPALGGNSTRGPVPAPPVDPDDLPEELRTNTKYKVLRLLGQGGMGVVYLTQHAIMDRLVAVKVINKALIGQGDALERFQREVKAAAMLDHPNIVRAYDSEQVGDLHLLAMEYVEGKSLAEVVAKNGPLPVDYACNFIRQAALGLQHAHERGMVHRDLKPHNLMVTRKGVVKILDFGLAKFTGDRKSQPGLTLANMAMGTPEYMAPEQAKDTKSADIRADIYSLGCTLFFLLTGRPPFPVGEDGQVMPALIAHLSDAPPNLCELRPGVEAELAALVNRMLAKNPADRPQEPSEVAQILQLFSAVSSPPEVQPSGQPASQATPASTPQRPETSPVQSSPRKPRRAILVTLAAFVSAIAAIACGIILWKVPGGFVVIDVPVGYEVCVDGESLVVKKPGGGPIKVTVNAGRKTVTALKDGVEMESRELTVKDQGATIRMGFENDLAIVPSPSPKAPEQMPQPQADLFVPGSTWKGKLVQHFEKVPQREFDATLTVVSRNGENFNATLAAEATQYAEHENIRKVRGTITSAGVIHWTKANTEVAKGHGRHFDHFGKLTDRNLVIKFAGINDNKAHTSGRYNLWLQDPSKK